MKRLPLISIFIGFAVLFICHSRVLASESELYKVGIGDKLSIVVIGHKNLSTLVSVAVDGTIAFPHIGNIYVKDKSLSEIEKEITEKLGEGYIKFPVVSVSLLSSQSKRIFIHGQVARIGTVPFEKDMSVIMALSLAGGIREDGLYGKLKVRRKKGETSGYAIVVESDLDNGNMINREVEDFLLQPEDIIIVERSDTFFIQGEVLKSGRYVLERNMTVSRALAVSGGITEYALHGKVKVMRKRENGSGYVDIKEANLDDGRLTIREMEDMLLQKDDILKIERNETIFIEGEVAKPSQYILEYGMTVGRAITIAGGIAEGGEHGKVKVRRKRIGESGFDDIEIDIKGIIEGSETADMILQPDDILSVERSKTYTVYGEVNRIGEFPITDDTTVFKAILAAGGFNKWGSENQIKVLRPMDSKQRFEIIKVDLGEVLDGDRGADIYLNPGDIVIVSSGLF